MKKRFITSVPEFMLRNVIVSDVLNFDSNNPMTARSRCFHYKVNYPSLPHPHASKMLQ